MFVPSLSWQMLVVFEYNEKYKTASKKEDPKKTYFHYIIYNIINIYIYIILYLYVFRTSAASAFASESFCARASRRVAAPAENVSLCLNFSIRLSRACLGNTIVMKTARQRRRPLRTELRRVICVLCAENF
jgi:hypothetical protein